MGFYLEMQARRPGEYAESEIPGAFWVLYAICGFALACMGGAAYSLLFDLAQTGWVGDQIMVGSILGAVPIYLLLGAKLAWVRKFVDLKENVLRTGFRFAGYPVWPKKILKDQISRVLIYNQKPSKNVAPVEHRDARYFIRGHWRVGLELKTGQRVILDKHTERDVIEPLFQDVKRWVTYVDPN